MIKRIEEFDILKGLGIICVVIGHTQIPKGLHSVIYSFHMPLFFLVSGFFYRPLPVTQYLKKSSNHLLIPWLFFAILAFLLFLGMSFVASHKFWHALSNTISQINLADENCKILYRSIWFLPVLFVVSNIHNIVNNFLNNYHLHGLVALSLLALGFWAQVNIDLPFFIDTILSVYAFYWLGSLIGQKKEVIHFKSTTALKIVSVLALFILCITSMLTSFDIDYKKNIYPIFEPLYAVLFVGVIFVTIKMWFGIKPINRFLVDCGKYSIVILGLHRLFQDLSYVAFGKCNISNAYLQSTIFVVVSLPIILYLSKLLVRFAPELIGFKRKHK